MLTIRVDNTISIVIIYNLDYDWYIFICNLHLFIKKVFNNVGISSLNYTFSWAPRRVYDAYYGFTNKENSLIVLGGDRIT